MLYLCLILFHLVEMFILNVNIWDLHCYIGRQTVLLAQMKQLSLKTQQHFSMFQTSLAIMNTCIW